MTESVTDIRLVDTHCHVQMDGFDEDRDAVIERSLDALAWMVLVGDDIESSRAALKYADNRIRAAVGVHPYHTAGLDADTLEDLQGLAEHECAAAIGEIGLDYFKYCDVPPKVQRDAFYRQLELAVKLALPVVIHNREADEDCAPILEEFASHLRGIQMHCFGSGPAFAERCLAFGAHISFAGNLTFPKAELLREAARVVPLDRLLTETDSPYLAPQPMRGKRCEPAYVMHTAERLAEVKGVTFEEIASRTRANAETFFRVTP